MNIKFTDNKFKYLISVYKYLLLKKIFFQFKINWNRFTSMCWSCCRSVQGFLFVCFKTCPFCSFGMQYERSGCLLVREKICSVKESYVLCLLSSALFIKMFWQGHRTALDRVNKNRVKGNAEQVEGRGEHRKQRLPLLLLQQH